MLRPSTNLRGALRRRLIPVLGGSLLLVYLGMYAVAETWVFRALPYDASATALAWQHGARRALAPLLKPDSWFHTAVARLRNDAPHPDVVLLNLDYDLVAAADTWPVPRSLVAEVVGAAAQAKPRLLVVDLRFHWPQTPWVLEALGRVGANDAAYTALLNELNHDGRLKRALAGLDYVLIYELARHDETLTETQRARYAATLWRQVRAVRVTVTGDGERRLFPEQRVHGVRDSMLPLQLRARGQGYHWFNVDRYGTLGQVPLLHRLQTADVPARSYYLPHVVAETVRAVEGADGYALRLRGGRAQSVAIGTRAIAIDPAGEMLVNFYGRRYQSRIPIVRANDLLAGSVDPERLRGKIVVFGSDANLANDFHATPAGRLWGTEILAYAVSNALNGDAFHRPSWRLWLEPLLLIVAGVVVLWAVPTLKPAQSLALTAALVGAVLLVAGAALVWRGVLLSVTVPGSFLALLYTQSAAVRFVREERQKRLYKNALSLYLSPALTEQVAANPSLLQLDGSDEELTVLFSDIRGFTALAERLAPAELTRLLHDYFEPMTDLVFAADGTLDKYIGDALMAFWGAPIAQPDHAERACLTAVRMLARVRELNAGWTAAGRTPLAIGIGIHTGRMRVGNMGSARRLSYTVIGDNVNLAARLQDLTPTYGVSLIVSDAVWSRVRHACHGRALDRTRVAGKQRSVLIHEIMGAGEAPAALAADLACWNDALAALRARRWEAAAAGFEHWQRTRNDAVAELHLRRIADFERHAPPPDWDGISAVG